MTFLTKLGETISATGKDVSQKAKDLTGIAKLNLDIRAKEEFVERQYMEIGKQYFELHKDDEEPFYEEITLIKDSLKEIEQLRSEIADLKGKKKCPACGTALNELLFSAINAVRNVSPFSKKRQLLPRKNRKRKRQKHRSRKTRKHKRTGKKTEFCEKYPFLYRKQKFLCIKWVFLHITYFTTIQAR